MSVVHGSELSLNDEKLGIVFQDYNRDPVTELLAAKWPRDPTISMNRQITSSKELELSSSLIKIPGLASESCVLVLPEDNMLLFEFEPVYINYAVARFLSSPSSL